MIDVVLKIYTILLLNVVLGVLILHTIWFINTWEMRRARIKMSVGWRDNTDRIIGPHG